ncbi:MAG: hypothetical protein RI967_1790 [Planctomycetota bacterium]
MQTSLERSAAVARDAIDGPTAPFLRLVPAESTNRGVAPLSARLAELESRPVEVQGTARPDGRTPSETNAAPTTLVARCDLDRDRDLDPGIGYAFTASDRTPDGEPIPTDPAELASLRARIVGRLYERDFERVHRFARKFARDEVAEEVAHEAFVRLLRVKNLERMIVGTAYLLRIAENLLKRRHERAERYRTVLDRYGMVVPGRAGLAGSTEAESPTVGRMRSDRVVPDAGELQAAMHALTREEQTAIRLIVCQGLDYQAAARSLGVPVSTINNWKHRGLAKLKDLVGSAQLAPRRAPAAAAC